MVRMLKPICCLAVLGLGAPWASAFSLLGPINETYQVPVIAYNLPGDIGAPKNLGEEYRRNTPVMYYSVDANFLDYFGSNGLVAIDQAFDILNGMFDGRNNGVTNISGYSAELSEWPLEAQRVNYQAEALSLLDIKSTTLGLMVEQLGLAEPDRYTWCLHDRLVGPGGCPQDVGYTVIKRNFDPVVSPLDVLQPSSYVNGTLYSYVIFEFCSGPNPLAEAVEFPVDPLASMFTAISAFGIQYGTFYTGLTRDDIGGLRYLWRTNNMNIEPAGSDTITFVTNTTTHQLLYSTNLNLFVTQALTNDAAALSALYPGLIVNESSFFFTNVVSTNTFAYYTNSPYDPFGAPARLEFGTNYTTNILTYYRHIFGNVITNTYYTTGRYTLLTTNVGPCDPPAPYGSTCTNVTAQSKLVPMIMGDIFIIPTNLCGYSVLATQLVQVLSETNLVIVATNASTTTTNIVNQEFSQSIITYFTNYVLDIQPVICPSNSVALRQGMERIQFVRRDYDSLLNRFYYPTNNEYILNSITNNTLIPQRIQRLVTIPDFLMTAQDGATDPSDGLLGSGGAARGINYSTNTAYPGIAGPGTIVPSTASWFSFNKVGPIYVNQSPNFMDEASQLLILIWGSFDGSTNPPVVYPNGTSIMNLENQVLIQINPPPPNLPDAVYGMNYNNLFSGFTASGGVTPPTYWSLPTNSPALPPGLTLNSDGTITGMPDAGAVGLTFDFTVRMMDATARQVDTPYAIKVVP